MGLLTSSLLLAAVATVPAAPSPVDLIRLTPANANVVMGANLAALRNHPAVQAWLAERQTAWPGLGGPAQELLREGGLDPFTDVDVAVVALVDHPAGEKAWLALFGGVFHPPSLAAALVKRGAEVVGEVPFLLLRTERSHRAAPFIAVGNNLVAVGDESSVVAAATKATLGAGLARVERAAGRLDPDATFWLAMEVPAAMREFSPPDHPTPPALRGFVQASQALQRLLLHIRVDQEIEIAGWALADTTENAELVHDAARGAVAALRLAAQQHRPEVQDVLRRVRINQRNEEVSGTLTLPIALLQQLSAELLRRPDRPERL